MFKKLLRIFVVSLAIMAMTPNQIFAQNQGKIECYDTDCVFELLKKMNSSDAQVVAEAEQTVTELVDYYRYTGDSRVGDALKNAIIPFVGKFPNCKSNQFLISQLPKVCDIRDLGAVAQLTENEQLADLAFRTIGEIKGSGDFIKKYIDRNPDNLKYKAALAYGIGKQNITEMEDVLISWIKGADDKTRIDIYNALWVIKTNEKTEAIVEKGAKKLSKSKDAETKIAGMRLLTTIEGEKAMPVLYKALKSDNGEVRKASLELMKPFANQDVVKRVLKKCFNGEALVDAINWMGEIKDDSQMEFLIKQLSSKEPAVVEATIRAIFKIDNADGVNAVRPMFSGIYQDVIKESLVAYKGDYRDFMNKVIKNGSPKQKLDALEIIESRPSVDMVARVKEMLNSDNQEVRDKAFKTLKLVMPAAQMDFLMALMEYCDEKYVEDVQLAIKEASANLLADRKDTYASTLKHIRPEMMPRFYKVFAYFGTDLCVEKLIDAYQNGDYKFDAKEALLLVENEAYKERIAEVLKD